METSVNNECKSFTSLEQSKKLSEILPLESADMEYMFLKKDGSKVSNVPFVKDGFEEPECCYTFIPCWSLTALIDILPCDWWGYNKHYFLEISKMGDMSAPYYVSYFRFREQSDGANFGRIAHISFQSDNLIDACVEMIIKLHEQKLL